VADCISLIDSNASIDDVKSWVQVSQMTNVEHTEEIVITSVASGYLHIEPFCVPNLDCRVVAYMVYHCCESGQIHTWTDIVHPHLHQVEMDTCVKLDCWSLQGKESSAELEVCWQEDACARLHELQCCQMDWLKNGKETSWSWRDSSGSRTFLTEGRLRELISIAQAECDAMSGVNSRCVTYGCNINGC